jgi:hypothetical protein
MLRASSLEGLDMMAINLATSAMTEQPVPVSKPSGRLVPECARADWSRAASLSERVQAHRQRGSLPGLLAGAQARGYRPAQAWRAQVPFQVQAVFSRRLAAAGMDEREFRALLGGALAPAAAGGDETPSWLNGLLAAYGRDAQPGSLDLAGPTPLTAAVAGVLEPLLSTARSRFRAAVRQLVSDWADSPVDPVAVERLLLARLLPELADMAGLTLLLECQGTDAAGLGLAEGEADGWSAFLEGLGRREAALDLFRRYPVLARLLWERVECWLADSLGFLCHLRDDWGLLRQDFGGTPGRLVAVDGWSQDHPWGRPLPHIACFASGLRLDYLPRPIGLERHFQQLLVWINDRGLQLPLRTRIVLDRGDHGWREAIEPAPCRTETERHRFHWRQGALAALGYALGAAPGAGQVVAVGEQALLMDADALFAPVVAELAADGMEVAGPPAADRLAADEVEAADSGFAALYGLLVAHREELLAEAGPLAAFAGDELRLRLRPEAAYMQLLDESCHPEYLGDALDRDRLFDRLWVAVAAAPTLDPLIAGEQAALRRGRVPEFIGRPGSRDLTDPRGAILPGFWPEPPLERARRRLERAGEVGRGD